MSPTNSGMASQPALRPEHSNASTANGTNTELTVLSRQPPFQQLSPSEREDLIATLDEDVREMQYLFGCLVTKTRDSIEERISVLKLAGSILTLGAYEPAPEGRDRSLLDEHSEEIKNAESISKVFIILNSYWNYLNYEILGYIVELYGTYADIERLISYNEKLCNFCKRRLFELPSPESGSGTDNASSSRQEKFKIKLDVREDITCKEALRIKRRIAKILLVNSAALIIVRVDVGCVQLTFLIPKFIAQEIFPLSDEQTSALSKDPSVIRLECGDYVLEVLTPMEWKTEFDDRSFQYLADVWEMFSSHCLKSNSPSTTWLHRVRKGCVSVTWLVPSDLVPQLIKLAEMNTHFFQKHRILKVTVGDRCVYEDEESTSVSILQTCLC